MNVRIGRQVLRWVSAGVCAVLLGGCATADKAYEGTTKVTNPDAVRLQGGIRWMNPHPNMRVVSPDRMTCYLRVRNTSGTDVDVIELTSRVRAGFEAVGYRVVRDVTQSHFVVMVDIRSFGENRTKDLGAGAVATTVAGGVAGAVIGHQVHHSNESTALGAAGGALIGAGLANIMANRNKMVEYDLVIDVRMGERIQGGVETTRRSEDDATVSHADSARIAQGGAEGGSQRGGSSETQRVDSTDDFLYHQNRLVAYAQKMNLQPLEAFPFLTQKIASALSGVLP